jgi:hypothetical protein
MISKMYYTLHTKKKDISDGNKPNQLGGYLNEFFIITKKQLAKIITVISKSRRYD